MFAAHAAREEPVTLESRQGSTRPGCLLAFLGAFAAFSACGPPSQQGQPVTEDSAVEEGYFSGTGGVRLFYRRVGAGSDTAVYLHGGPWNMSDGGYELDDLANSRALIAFDQRSGGRSELVSDPKLLTADYYVQDVEALRRHFALERMILIGQSWGAGVAVQYAARHPNRVSRLLLLSPLPPARDPYWTQREERINSVIGEDEVARIAELVREIGMAPDDRVQELCRHSSRLLNRAYLTDLSALERMKVGYCDASPEAIRHQYMAVPIAHASLGDYDFLPLLADLQIPILVVEGAETHVPLEATRAWAAAAHEGRLLLVPGANHLTWLEGDVPAFLRLLDTFLSGAWPEGSEEVGDEGSRLTSD